MRRIPVSLAKIFLFVLILMVGGFRVSWAVRPISNNIALVAGGRSEGYRDGSFTTALFKRPYGLAISPDGSSLYVSDTGNNRIRIVHLDQADQVTTLAGQDQAGNQNGSLDTARFNQPQGIVCLPDDRLIINDLGNGLLRLLDLKERKVSVLGGAPQAHLAEGPASQVSMAGVQAMAYQPTSHCLFFSQPQEQALKRLDLNTGIVSFVLHASEVIPEPFALCSTGKDIYVADHDRVFKLIEEGGGVYKPQLIATLATTIMELTGNESHLYALNKNDLSPVVRVLPAAEPVTFVTSFGDVVPNPGKNLPSFNSDDETGSFVLDPRDPSKIYVSNPSWGIITSFRDLFGHWDNWYCIRNSSGLNEPEYPTTKPSRTFRILLCGDSHSAVVSNYPLKNTWNIQNWNDGVRDRDVAPPRQVSLSKRMELELNTLAALDNLPYNFEVLNLFHNSNDPHLFLWPTYEVPEAVKKNDIDLVVILETPTVGGAEFLPLTRYYLYPLTKEGIPSESVDPEYLLKPPIERIPDGETRQFFEKCKSKDLVHIDSRNMVFDEKVLADPDLHAMVVDLYEKPLAILSERLSTLKSSSKKPISLVLCTAHTGPYREDLVDSEEPKIWAEVTKRVNVSYLDLNEEINALNLSFFPLSENYDNAHLNPDGHLFFSFLLDHDLIRDGYLPFREKEIH